MPERGRNGKLVFNESRVSISDDEKALEMEMDGGNGCTILGMNLMPLDVYLKMVKVANFMLYVFTTT